MGYWEPIATPGSHMEPPDPEEEWCEICEEELIYCDCVSCESCGERGPWEKVQSESEMLYLCKPCIAI